MQPPFVLGCLYDIRDLRSLSHRKLKERLGHCPAASAAHLALWNSGLSLAEASHERGGGEGDGLPLLPVRTSKFDVMQTC